MSGWITERADAYCDSVRDGTHDSPKPVERGHRLITSKHIANETLNFAGANCISDEDYEAINQRSRVDIGDLLFSMIGTVGRVYRVDKEPDYAIKNMGLFKISDELKSKYLFYYMQSPTARQYIDGCLAGSTQKFMSLTSLRAFPIVYPGDHATMAAIVDILDSITWKYRINQRTNDYLAELIRAEFDYRYDGAIPTVELGDVLTISTKALKPSSCIGEVWEHFSIPAFDEGRKPVFELADGIKSNKYTIDNNCILISKLNPSTKRLWLPYCTSERSVCSTEFIVYKPKVASHKSFYYAAIDSPRFTDFLLAHVTGSTGSRQRSQPRATLGYPMPYPGVDEIEDFCAYADPLITQWQVNEQESIKLAKLRDALLPKLMSGEIDVSEVELPTQPNNHLQA